MSTKKLELVSNDVYSFFDSTSTNSPIGFVSIPHSGEQIPEVFKNYLISEREHLDADVDYKMEEMIDIPTLQKEGVIILVAKVHRACVDLNRAGNIAVLNWKENTHGVNMVLSEPSVSERLRLEKLYHAPYYDAIKTIISYLEQFKNPLPVIDLHSMPSNPTAYHLKLNPNQNLVRPDFCVSDLGGENPSCKREYIDHVIEELQFDGYTAVRNDPYFGGNVTKYVNTFNTNNIQIETKRSIYMDEIKRVLLPESKKVKKVLTDLVLSTFKNF